MTSISSAIRSAHDAQHLRRMDLLKLPPSERYAFVQKFDPVDRQLWLLLLEEDGITVKMHPDYWQNVSRS